MSLIPKHAMATVSLMVISGLAYFAQGASLNELTNWGLLYAPNVASGEWWRVVTSAFLHGDILHLLLNMGLLFAFGQQLEQAIGWLRFCLVYAGSVAAASLCVVAFAPASPTLGASGAVIGIAVSFAVVLMLFGRDGRHQSLFLLIALNLAMPLLVPGISFWGHLGGALGGLLMTLVLIVLPFQIRKKQIAAGGIYTANRHPMALPTVIAGVVLVLGLFAASIAAAVRLM